jgi:hypothetical protein
MMGMIQRTFLILLLAGVCCAQQTAAPTKPGAKSPAGETAAVPSPGVDLQALVKETEQVDMQAHKMGVFWWVPIDFWEASLRAQGYSSTLATSARKTFEPFGAYNVFLIAVGDMGVGDIAWMAEKELKKNIVLRDQHGNTYKPLEELPEDITPMVEIMKPIFKGMMGNFGAGLQFILFPAKDKEGNRFADPRKSSDLFLDVTGLMGAPTSTYTWRLPLTSLTPPKYCPAGKEKVEASWKYCPWHGVKLTEDAPAAPVAAPSASPSTK